MESTSFVALSRQTALRRQLEVIAHNMANMNTTGFKGEKLMFVDHVVKSRGGERVAGDRVAYTRDIATLRDLSEGPLNSTGNPLDVTVRGEAYFVVETPEGIRYTRNGRFELDGEGRLVTEHGHPVMSSSNSPFTFGPTDGDIAIAADGSINTRNGKVGKLGLVTFENRQELRAVAGGLYTTDKEATPAEKPVVVQGMLEGSNVEPIIEITRLIDCQRSYDNARKLIQDEDDRVKKTVQEMVRAA